MKFIPIFFSRTGDGDDRRSPIEDRRSPNHVNISLENWRFRAGDEDDLCVAEPREYQLEKFGDSERVTGFEPVNISLEG